LKGQDDLICILLRVYAGDKQAVQQVFEMKGALIEEQNDMRDYRLKWLT